MFVKKISERFSLLLVSLSIVGSILTGCARNSYSLYMYPDDQNSTIVLGKKDDKPTVINNNNYSCCKTVSPTCKISCCCTLFLAIGITLFLLPCFGVYGNDKNYLLSLTYGKCV